VRDRFSGARGEALNLTDGHTGSRDLACERDALGRVRNRQQCARVTSSNAAFLKKGLDRLLQTKQSDGIGDCCAVFSGALSDLLLGESEFVHQALECVRLFHRIKILALQILHEGHFEGELFGHSADHDGHALQRRALRGAPTPLAGNQLIAGTDFADNKRLDNPARLNRASELIEGLLTEARARLVRAGIDQIDVDLKEPVTRSQGRSCRCRCSRRR